MAELREFTGCFIILTVHKGFPPPGRLKEDKLGMNGTHFHCYEPGFEPLTVIVFASTGCYHILFALSLTAPVSQFSNNSKVQQKSCNTH
jgi:hypothetical protein